MAEPQQKRSISFSVDLDELLRVCKAVVAVVAAVSLLALAYYYYETLALYCFRPGVLIFLLVNVGVVVIALSSGVTIKGGSPNSSKRSTSAIEEEDTLIASVLGSESGTFPGRQGVGEEEEVEIRQEEREKEKYEASKPEKEAKKPKKEAKKPEKVAEREKEEAVEKQEEREIISEREETVKLEVKAFPSFERARSFTTRLFRSSSETISVKHPKAPPAVQIRRRIEESGSQTEDSLKMKKAASVAGEKATSDATAAAAVKDVDKAADDFISRFYQQMKLQRLDSVLRYKNRTD